MIKERCFIPHLVRFMEKRGMGYTKEQRLEAANKKREQQISLEIMRELRELTGEPFDKLETYLKEEIPANIFKVESKSVLYRKVGSVDNELKSERTNLLKEHEGELRIRLIDTVIKNNDNQDKMLRLLCSYEIRTRYFHYKKIDRNKPMTQQILMSHVENIQNQNLKFPIGSVLLTQKIVDDVSDISYWDLTNKQKVEDEKFSNADDKRIIRIEQKNFPINKLGIEIDNAEKTTTVLSSLSDATQHYQVIAKKRLKQHQKIVISKIARTTGIEIKANFLQKMEHQKIIVMDDDVSSLASVSESPIAATTIEGASVGAVMGVAAGMGIATVLGGPFGIFLGSLIGSVKALAMPTAYGMPLKIFQDLAEEIDREEAEENETNVIEAEAETSTLLNQGDVSL